MLRPGSAYPSHRPPTTHCTIQVWGECSTGFLQANVLLLLHHRMPTKGSHLGVQPTAEHWAEIKTACTGGQKCMETIHNSAPIVLLGHRDSCELGGKVHIASCGG